MSPQTGAYVSPNTNKIVHKRLDCRACHSLDLKVVLPLEPIPVASPNIKMEMGDAHAAASLGLASLHIYRCEQCGHIQLLDVLDPGFQYTNFQYTTSISLGLSEHFKTQVADIERRLGSLSGKFVLEIGSNDGTLLALCQERGARVLGIDPAQKAAGIANTRGIPTICDFFSPELARSIHAEHGPADVIICNYTFANIDDLDGFGGGMSALLMPGGIISIETSYGADVMEGALIDTIYHEHLSYFLVEPLRTFFRRFGVEMIDAERIPTKGGSIRCTFTNGTPKPTIAPAVDALINQEKAAGYAGRAPYDAFMRRMEQITTDLQKFIATQTAHGRRIGVFGASVGSMPMTSQFQLWKDITFIADDKPLVPYFVHGSRSIPVLNSNDLNKQGPCALIILAWRYSDSIARRVSDVLGAGVPLAVPLPTFHIVETA